jgi:hypothetical protein
MTKLTDLRNSLTFPVEDFRWLGWNAVLVAIYWATLTYSYIYAVSPVNEAEFTMYLKISPPKIIEGIIWTALMIPTVNASWRKPSDFGLSILYFFAFVPTLVIYGLADQPRPFMYMILSGYMAVVATCKIPFRIPLIRLQQAGRTGAYLAAIGTILIAAWFVARGNRDMLNLNLLDVYEYREEAGRVFDFGPIAYLASWTPRVLAPFLFCYFLLCRKWTLFLVAFAFQLSCLVIFQEKSVLIPCVMLPLLYFAPSERMGRVFFILGIAATIVICDVIYIKYDFALLSQLWTRRFFFDQQFLYYNYIDIFSKIGNVYFSDSFLSEVVHYPFQYPPANMVSYYMSGHSEANANTGFMGAGYMEMGAFGIVLGGAFAGLVLKIFDRVTSPEMPMWFFGTSALLPFMAMLVTENSQTSLLTGGIVPLLLLMMFMRHVDRMIPGGAKLAPAE